VSSRLCSYGGQEKLRYKGGGGGFDFIFLAGSLLEGKSMSILKFLLLFRCVFEAMLMVKVNLGFHKLFGIKYMFVSGV
jgi:hypothetical protein